MTHTPIPLLRRKGLVAATAGLTLYALSLLYWYMAVGDGFGDILFIGLIMGAAFGGIALATTTGMKPIGQAATPFRHEGWWIAVYVAFLTLYLAFGPGFASTHMTAALRIEVPAEFLKLLEKLLVFVALPWFLFYLRQGRSRLTFGIPAKFREALAPRSLALFVLFAAAFSGIQAVFGQHWTGFTDAMATGPAFWAGVAFTYAWLFLEVGVVEEFAFRAFLQDRIAALLGSPVAGLVIGALVFALAHVPGLFLRTFDGGQSLIFTTAYALLVLAPASIAFAVIWMRTRNLLPLMAIHASVDLIPNYGELSGLIGL